MEKTLVETHFGKITLDLDNLLVKQIFIDSVKEIEDTEFYEFMEIYVNTVLDLKNAKQIRPYSLKTLVDVREADFVIVPKMQDEVNQKLLSKLTNTTEKIAFIQPKDFFTYASIQQMMDEDINQTAVKRYFDNETDALKWLKV